MINDYYAGVHPADQPENRLHWSLVWSCATWSRLDSYGCALCTKVRLRFLAEFFIWFLFHSKLINALGGGIWTVVLGDYDRDHVNGEEVEMVVDYLEIHPNFTDYQNDIGIIETYNHNRQSLFSSDFPSFTTSLFILSFTSSSYNTWSSPALLKLPRSLPGLTPICLPQQDEYQKDDFLGLR